MSVNISGLDFWTVGKCNTPVEGINHGALYNWYAATDAREITSAGWHVPIEAEWDTLRDYLGGWEFAGGKLKEVGLVYWDTPNTGADNLSAFNGRGSGYRSHIGPFVYSKRYGWFITSTEFNATSYNGKSLMYNTAYVGSALGSCLKKQGISIRPLKDSTTLSDGETGTYTDPSGYIYRTICIGIQEWVADNIKTEHYRTGDAIPVVTDNGDWAALVTGAMCYYNNDSSNA